MNLHHKQQARAYNTGYHDDTFASAYSEESFVDERYDDNALADTGRSSEQYDSGFESDLSWIEQADADNYHSASYDTEQALSWFEADQECSDESFTSDPGDRLFNQPADPAAIQQVVASFSQLIPAIIRAVGQHPQARQVFEAEAGIPYEQIDPNDAEVWPAIIGAIASAVPAIVGAVSQAVRGSPRRQAPARPRPGTPPRQTSTRPPCPPTPQREAWSGEDDAEAVQLAALIPVLLQLLPVITPLINQMIPLLTKALPALLTSFGKMTAGSKNASKENRDTMSLHSSFQTTEACQTEDILGDTADIDVAADDLP